MQVNEIFSSIDGEGIRTGYPVTFIRTQFCNLRCKYCFGPNKRGRYPNITMVDGTKVSLNEVKVGDTLLTLDENKNIVETIVQNVSKRETNEYHNISFPDTTLCVTPEHPFYVEGNWIEAQNLTSTSKCYKVKMMEYALYKVYGENYKSKLTEYSKNILNLLDSNLHGNSGSNNGNYNPDYKYRNYNKLKRAIKLGLCQDILEGEDQLVVHHLDENKENDDINNLVIISAKLHNQLHGRGFSFGVGIDSHDYPVTFNSKNYGESPNKIMGYKEKTFINLSCYPYNTFLVEDIYVHNCDTKYSWDAKDENGEKQYRDMTILEIVEKCNELKNKRITFTGGEPLIQKDAAELVETLLLNDYQVNIETNGAVNIEEFYNSLNLEELGDTVNNLIFTLDYKTSASGEEEKMIMSNISFLQDKDVLKFVVGSESELDKMKEIVEKYNPSCEVFISPVFGQIEPKDLVEYILKYDLQQVRVQIQLHKIIWDPNKRGV